MIQGSLYVNEFWFVTDILNKYSSILLSLVFIKHENNVNTCPQLKVAGFKVGCVEFFICLM